MCASPSFLCFLEKELFPWGGLPYPSAYAKEGIASLERGDQARAEQIASFLEKTVDHRGKPLASFFRQEKGEALEELEEVTRRFFALLGRVPTLSSRWVEGQLGISLRRTEEETTLLFGSGCKSSMGIFLVGDAGVVAFAPQLSPLGDCTGFGLAGRGMHLVAEEEALQFCCRLASPSPRDTGIPWLEDSGYSRAWVESSSRLLPDGIRCEGVLEGFRPLSDFHFSFFGKATACRVGRGHKLTPCSLDRYHGPAQPVVLDSVTLFPERGFSTMEIIPLAGEGEFWGADFLIAFTMANAEFRCTVSRG